MTHARVPADLRDTDLRARTRIVDGDLAVGQQEVPVTNMHGTHCEDADGTLTCGWPDQHPVESVRRLQRAAQKRVQIPMRDMWADVDFDPEFSAMILARYPEVK